MRESVIDLQDVSWERDGKPIVRHVDWQVQKGEHWAVMGLNGSGKTTILNLINGYIWPTSGTVSVLGSPFGTIDLRELRKSIGWVSSSLQERLYPTSRAEHIVLSGKYATIGLYDEVEEADLQRAHELMDQLGCAHLVGRTYQTCSQGEKQKLLIARALMASPKLLILDEACNGLDFLARESLLAGITDIASRPDAPTLLLVTHHIEEILPIFSHTLMVRRGDVFAQGRSSELLQTATLSAFFETPVHIERQRDRAWLSVP
ncbi:ABC transporter ATP-binding protein [Paenibacillus daejeonensis]|uniref:ABC transporter ATP-binding protein n=1 Tax=Paenibacillus daejeonensis TaxID=135193 RepID=UPI00037E7B3E|nr:ABC transporter ATP-binding protein [Paenibacillus daejeonensis]